ncbi:fungal-specific transcription factor domain-containing protein [Podospora appendiculata]|uniref:Fungal-specific transcription factor domain-containing protein n=1 Tax=Podospora appendiculata TaxID=314037 RepID=A0AAE1C9C2_9PEZI|nr:fungal-specific transcription factor domain-containing protein [Podospora appendiculata]
MSSSPCQPEPELHEPTSPRPKAASTDGDSCQAGETTEDSSLRPPPRKRRRTVISCTECHRRKQKCDRKLPCTNCVTRTKQGGCRYEAGAPTVKEPARGVSDGGAASPDVEEGIPTKVANFGYSQTGASTLGFLQRIDGVNPDEPLSKSGRDVVRHDDHVNMRERFKGLMRQLPARTYIDKLVDLFFVDFNWQYCPLDRDVFDRQLAEWYRLPFNQLSTGGPQSLPPDLRVFPGLLFQVLAISLLVLPDNPDPVYESLKYAGNMTFQDLAMDYSESGVAILSLLGKRQMTVTTVLAGFIRAAFLKYVALVTESWHAIGTAIRDAQEIGLHRDCFDPKPKGDDVESVLANQWEIQHRRKVWMNLVICDVQTGMVLGRPMTIEHNAMPATLPVDAVLPIDRSKSPPVARGEDDPPTPLTRLLWIYEITMLLREVVALEKEGPCPTDFSKVDKLREVMLDVEARTPPFFREKNPDTKFDRVPSCYWLPAGRGMFPHLFSFSMMALHRPYIFTRPTSRTEALKASLRMLTAQRMHFKKLQPYQYKMFSLFFGTFDAIVLMASIYILFPKEHPGLVKDALRHFQWAVERFQAMSEHNGLARAAMGVLQAIYLRLRRALHITPQAIKAMMQTPSVADAGPSSSLVDFSPRLSEDLNNAGSSTFPSSAAASDIFADTAAGMAQEDEAPACGGGGGFDWSIPSDFDWASLQPIYATGDLAYHDLTGVRDGHGHGGTAVPASQPWQFEGDFGTDSVWSLLNHYTPY